ncbi:glycosyltransferase [Novosphingobium colocasiae]
MICLACDRCWCRWPCVPPPLRSPEQTIACCSWAATPPPQCGRTALVFFDQVWPSIRRQRPDTQLDIAGSVASAFPGGGPPGVHFHGMVPDLAPLYAAAGVAISPLTFGSGLKIKLVEALAHGKAVVATATTLQGVEDTCGGAVIQADDAARFADAVVALAQAPDRRVALAAAALDCARRHFSSQACHAAFIAWLEEQTSPAKVRR